ncbi:hypothetical protein CQA38_04865 [Campylobacter sp. MIT 12-5580]|uniref:hypothetical protein n=1 Tax=Campylobacter sp. MIT 12-5580 TaxID=2040651 RepID=UPI0010F7B94C|nr:hypothetical protein [Campylobacter sp. MIT 12-5580]TKX29415.1 hypothetical protein CQA38_04865 [Campylobacter sp. MIT 12-5580]
MQTIYVRLLDEDIEVFVPVNARKLFDKVFEIISYDKNLKGEALEFNIGDKVLVEYKELGEFKEKKKELIAIKIYKNNALYKN